MANALGRLFQDIADAIRSKTGDTSTMKPSDFPTKIRGIEAGGDNEYAEIIYGIVSRKEEYTSGKSGLLKVPPVVSADNGNSLISLSSYTMAGYSRALYAQFSGQTWIYDYALGYNAKLKLVDFELTSDNSGLGFMLLPYSLYGCTALESLIIRYDGEEAYPNDAILIGQGLGSGTGVLEGTNDTFYIYVSSSIYDIVVAKNPTYRSRIRKLEDYPDVDTWMDNI